MKYDIVIKNGTIIDPLIRICKKQDLFIKGDMIVDGTDEYEAKQIIDAEDYVVAPGLIENHTHLYYGGTDSGLDGDLFLLPNGVTTAIDQGSSGAENFENFYRTCICQNKINTKAYLNVAGMGMPIEGTFENIDPDTYDKDKIKYILEKYKGTVLGIKLRICSDNEKELGFKPLEKTIELAEELGVHASVHIKSPKFSYKKYAPYFRKGDIWIHMYSVKGNNCIDPDTQQIYEELIEAKKRGVLFDVASGRSSFSFEIIRKAFEKGFTPDLLGTDLVSFNAYQRPIFSLPYTMSLYMSLGYELMDVIEMTTARPARIIGDENLATLQSGTIADIAILEDRKKEIEFKDVYGGINKGEHLLIPKCTIKSGKVVYRSTDY